MGKYEAPAPPERGPARPAGRRTEVRSPKERMIELLLERSVRTGSFTLASGRKSDFFIDCKQAVLTAEGHEAAGMLFLEAVARRFPEAEAVAGVALGGCPLASATSIASLRSDFRNLPALYVRKAAKDHGTKVPVEGMSSVGPGTKVVLLEDVVTTGGSSVRAVQALFDQDLEVLGVIALVDRQEGAVEGFRDAVIGLRRRHPAVTEEERRFADAARVERVDRVGVNFLSILRRDNLVPPKTHE